FEEFNNKTVYVKDMSDMLTGNKDERNAIFGKLRNAYDGYLEKGFGTMKTKARVDAKFGLIIGMTPIIDAYYTLSNQLGERFIKVRVAIKEDETLSSIYRGDSDEYIKERHQLQQKIVEYLSSIDTPKYEAPPEYEELLINLAKFTASMRTAVYVNIDGDGSLHFRGERELPTRLLNQAKKLLFMLAAVRGKKQVTKEEIDFVGKTLIQTPPLYRIQAFYSILQEGAVNINTVARELGVRHEKAEQVIEELYFLKIVIKPTEDDNVYLLNPEFEKLGKLYLQNGWYSWLPQATKEFKEMKRILPRKHIVEKEENWLLQETLPKEED
ncbi:MAG: hypothetical protein NWE98_02240, partial [Candidatus Bathyarchaeota archaeon]|nr:hypothetical protein [Candidatus Bathyarchaeota archaeon]